MAFRDYKYGRGVRGRVLPIPAETRESLIELMCAGSSLTAASRAGGVSHQTSVRVWRRFGHVELTPILASGYSAPVLA